MTGFWSFNKAASQEQEEADQTVHALRRNIQKRIGALQGQIRAHGVRGDFALAGARSAASDFDLGEVVGGMTVSLILWGSVSMAFGPDAGSHYFGSDDSDFSLAGLTEGLGFLIDAEIDGPNAAKKRRVSGYYPEGRRQSKIETARDLFAQFNSVANGRSLDRYSQSDLKSEMRFMQILLKALGQLDRAGKGYEFIEETRFQGQNRKQAYQAA